MSANTFRMLCVGVYVLILIVLVGCGGQVSPVVQAASLPEAEAVASVSGEQVTITVDVPKGGRVTEVVVQFKGALYEGSMSDACAGWYRSQDMWGLTWAIQVEGNALIIRPATRKDDLVQGTWTVHVQWYRGTVLPELSSIEVK